MVKRIGIFLVGIIVLVSCFFAGYFTMKTFADKTSSKNIVNQLNKTGVANAESGSHEGQDLINENTQIIKKEIYLNDSEKPVESTSNPEKELIGLNKEKTEEYFKKQGFYIVEFTKDKVVVEKRYKDAWPPNKYIIKESEGKIMIFISNEKGLLTDGRDLEIDPSGLSEDMQEILKQGRAFDSQEEIDEYIANNIDS